MIPCTVGVIYPFQWTQLVGMSNRKTEVALGYHQRTKHSYESVHSDPHFLDWSNRPIPFKTYLGLKPLPLPSQWEETEVPALQAISGLTTSTKSEAIPTLNQLARLLYFSAGLTKTSHYPGGEIQFRAASCTGALYQVELYVVCGTLPDLSAGLYHFSLGTFHSTVCATVIIGRPLLEPAEKNRTYCELQPPSSVQAPTGETPGSTELELTAISVGITALFWPICCQPVSLCNCQPI